MKKAILGYLGFFVVAMGTLVVSHFITQNQDLRRSASTNKVDLALSGPTSVNQGDTFQVNVIVTKTNSLQVTAADIQLQVDNGNLTLTGITKGNFFSTSNMARPPQTTSFDTIGTELLKDVVNRRYAIGALCDYCYLGNAPNPNPYNLQLCPANPTCYAKTYPGTATNNVLATYSFRAENTGTATISFAPPSGTSGTQVAVIGSDDNMVSTTDFNTLNVTISTPTTTCIIDLDDNGTVSLADYGIFKTRYITYLQTQTYDATIDIDQNGSISLADYGQFKTKFINFTQTGTCN